MYTRGASTDAHDPYPSCGTHSRDRRVWYRYVATTGGVLTLDTSGSDYATIISAYTGTCGTLAPVDNGCDAGQYYYYPPRSPQVAIPVSAGTTYYFMISATNSDGGNMSLRVTAGLPPPTSTPTPTTTWYASSPTPAPAAPSNDACSDATVVTTLPFTDAADVRIASTDASDPYPSCGTHSRDRRVWYRYVAPVSGAVTLDTSGSTYNPIISAYTGACGALVPVDNGCSTGTVYYYPPLPAQLSIPVSAGVTYYFMVSATLDYSFGGYLSLRITAGVPTATPTATPTSTWNPTPTTPAPPPPANDSCSDGTLITSLPFSDYLDNVRSASTDATDPYPSCGTHSRDRRVWYRYVAAATGAVTLDTSGSNYNLIISAYTGTCGVLLPIDNGCSTGSTYYYPPTPARLSIAVSAGVTYYFMVSANAVDSSFGGSLSLQVTAGMPTPTPTVTPTPTLSPTPAPAPPSNDSCSDGTLITSLPFTDLADVRSASTDASDPYPNCGTHSRDRRVWYRYVAPVTGALTLDTTASNYDTIISAYTGACGVLVPVDNGCTAGNRYTYPPAPTQLSIPVSAGVTYYFMVSASAVDYSFGGSLLLRVSAGMPTPTPTVTPTPTSNPTPTPPPPPNDSCGEGTVINSLPFTDRTNDVLGASTDANDPYPSCGSQSRDRRVWYRYIASTGGTITLDTAGSTYNTIVSAYTGVCGALVPVNNGCDAGNYYGYPSSVARLSITVTTGTTYYFMVSASDVTSIYNLTILQVRVVAGGGTSTGSPTPQPTLEPTPIPPPNDSCDQAGTVTAYPYWDVVDTRGASTDASDPYPSCGNGSRDRRVWYRYVAPATGVVTADTFTSNYSTIVSAYTGTCNALDPVDGGCNAGDYYGSNPHVSLPVIAGTTYYFMVSAADHRGGSLGFRLLPGAPTPTPTATPSPTNTAPPTPVPPANDGCDVPAQIDALPYFDLVDTRGASTSAEDPYPSCGSGSRDRRVWYRYVAATTGAVTLDTAGSTYSTIVSAYTGTCGALVPVVNGCESGNYYYYPYSQARLSIPVTAGVTYYFMASASTPSGGILALSMVSGAPAPTPTLTPTPTNTMPPTPVPPVNDACDMPGQIDALPYFDLVDTRGASTGAEDPYPPCGGGSRDRRVWYRYVAATTGTVTLDTAGSTYSTIVSAYTGTCGALVPVVNGCNAGNYYYPSSQARLSIPVTAGATYYLMISATNPPGGILALSLVSGQPVPTPTPTSTPPPPTSTMPPTPAPPPNDACSAPAPISALPYFDLVDTRGSSTDAQDPYPSCGSGSRDRRVWYRFAATNSGMITLDTSNSQYNTIISVYTGTCGALVPVTNGCSSSGPGYSSQAQLTMPVTAGTTYYVMVSASSASGGILEFSALAGGLNPTPTPSALAASTMPPTPVPPPNDACSAPAQIDAIPYFDLVDTLGASTSAQDPYPPCGGGSRDRRVWYQFNAANDGLITLDTANSQYNTIISVYTGTCGALVPVSNGCSSWGPGYSSQAQLTIPVTAGTTYHVMVSSSSLSAGILSLGVVAGGPSPTGTPVPTQTPAPPPNDHCEEASEVPGVPYIDQLNMVTAGTDTGDPVPNCGTGGRFQSVWYRLVSPFSGSLAVNPTVDYYSTTIVSAYTGECGSLVPIANGCLQIGYASPEPLTLQVTKGTTYYFMLSAAYANPYSVATGLRMYALPAASAPCIGDCNGDGVVTIDELLSTVNIALGGRPLTDCLAADPNHDGTVTIDEILQAVNAALNGCG